MCYVMLCYVMLCYVMLCYVMLCYVMLCYVMLCYVMLCYVMLCYVMLCYVMLCYYIKKKRFVSPKFAGITSPKSAENRRHHLPRIITAHETTHTKQMFRVMCDSLSQIQCRLLCAGSMV